MEAEWGEATQTVKPARQRAKMMGISFVKLFLKKERRRRISAQCADRISVACALQKMFVVTHTNKA